MSGSAGSPGPILVLNSVIWDPEYDPCDPLWDVGGWFRKVFDGSGAILEIRQTQTDLPASLDGYSALVLTGSPAGAYDPDPWIEELKDTVREAADRQLPTLGVCFGSQLIAQALGGKVEINPNGWEIGNCEVELTPEGVQDPLFHGYSHSIGVMESHQDYISSLPRDAVLLATNSHTQIQAFGIGNYLRAIQFHPEMGPEHLQFILPPRRERILRCIGLDINDLLPNLYPTPGSGNIFLNFYNNFVAH